MQAKPSWGAVVALTCLTTMMALAPQRARAEAVIENIFQDDTQVGTISFPAFSGTDASNSKWPANLGVVRDAEA